MRTIVAVVFAVMSSGCVAVGMDPLLAATQPTPVPSRCAPYVAVRSAAVIRAQDVPQRAAGDADHGEADGDVALCDSLRNVWTMAGRIQDAALQLDRAQTGLGGTQLAAGVATLGFTAFKAHPDNALAAGLIGGSALAARDGLRPLERRNALSAALNALNCTIEHGAVFIGAAGRADTLEKNANDTALAGLLIQRVAPRNDAAKTAELNASLDRLTTAIAHARDTLAPMRAAATQVDDTVTLIRGNLRRKLDALEPDYTAIATAIGKVATPAPSSPSSPPAGGNGESNGGPGPHGQQPNQVQNLQTVLGRLGMRELTLAGSGRNAQARIEDLIALADELSARLTSQAGPGASAYTAIAQCAAAT